MFDKTSRALRCKQPNVSDGSHIPDGWGEMQELVLELSRCIGCLRLGREKRVGRSDELELVWQHKLYIHRQQKHGALVLYIKVWGVQRETHMKYKAHYPFFFPSYVEGIQKVCNCSVMTWISFVLLQLVILWGTIKIISRYSIVLWLNTVSHSVQLSWVLLNMNIAKAAFVGWSHFRKFNHYMSGHIAAYYPVSI